MCLGERQTYSVMVDLEMAIRAFEENASNTYLNRARTEADFIVFRSTGIEIILGPGGDNNDKSLRVGARRESALDAANGDRNILLLLQLSAGLQQFAARARVLKPKLVTQGLEE